MLRNPHEKQAGFGVMSSPPRVPRLISQQTTCCDSASQACSIGLRQPHGQAKRNRVNQRPVVNNKFRGNATGSPYSRFTFQVQDNGGTANGGIDHDSTPQMMMVNVTPLNKAPTGINKTITTLEDAAFTFTAGDFGFCDANNTPPNNLLAVKIKTLPTAGTMADNVAAVVAGQRIAAAHITAGLLRFSPAANASGAPYANFSFQVQDDGGTAKGGIDLDPTPRTMIVNVTPLTHTGSDRACNCGACKDCHALREIAEWVCLASACKNLVVGPQSYEEVWGGGLRCCWVLAGEIAC
jgi:hypothetical protein